MKRTTCMVAIMGSLLAGCRAVPGITHNIDETDAMKSALAERIPAGTSVADAKRFMEQEGFECSVIRESKNGIDEQHLWCDRHDSHNGSTFVARRWQVWFPVTNNAVGEVNVSSGLVGP